MCKSDLIIVLFSCMNIVGFSQVNPVPGTKANSNSDYTRALAVADSKPDSALYYIDRYRKSVPEADSVAQKRSISFYNYMGARYLSNYYTTDSIQSRTSFKKALALLEKVIELDSTSLSANMNLMSAHYNSGVKNIINGDYCKQRALIEDTDWNKPDPEIPSLAKLLECIKPEEYEKYRITPPFKAALPFALRIHRLDPANRNALEALQGIYMALSDKKQAEIYKRKYEKLSANKAIKN